MVDEVTATAALHLCATLEGRAAVLSGGIGRPPAPTLLLTPAPHALVAALPPEPARGHIQVLAGIMEPAEWDLRLAELAAGAHAMLAMDWRLLWDGQIAVALSRWSPRLIGIEASSEAPLGRSDPLALELLLARVRRVLPRAAITIATAPPGLQARRWLEEITGAPAQPRDPVLPANLAIRVVRAGTAQERWETLLNALAPEDAPRVVVSPSRASAIGAAARLGQEVLVYHGGLSQGERAAVLDAFSRRRAPLLVTTQTLPRFASLPVPAIIVLTHPPRTLETVIGLGAWAARHDRPVRLVIVSSDQNLAALRAMGSTARPGLADLRLAYQALRRAAVHGYVRTTPETLATALPSMLSQPYLLAQCLDALERAGYLIRDDDMGRAAVITVAVQEPAVLAARGLPPWEAGIQAPIDPFAIALAHGEHPAPWQRRLFETSLDGFVRYHAAGRERLYRLAQPGPDASVRLRALVQRQIDMASEDGCLAATWLEAPECRVRTLAMILELPAPAPCGRCDRCAPQAVTATTLRSGEGWYLALRALAEVSIALPEGAAVRIVRQAFQRVERPAESQAIRAAMAHLLEHGLIHREAGVLRPRLQVTEAGRASLTTPDTGEG